MKLFNFALLGGLLALAWEAKVQAQSLAPGNLIVLRLGDGSQTLTNSGNSMFLDQYTTNGAVVSTITIPDNGANALLLSGVASSEGGLNRSADRTVLAIAGYSTNRGAVTGSLSGQSAAAVPRAVATVDATGNYSLVQASTTLYNSNNIRCATTDGTNNFWTAGGNSGTYYLAPPQPPAIIQSSIVNTRYVKIVGGRLYFSTQAGVPGIYTFQSAGLPKSATATNLLFATGSTSQPAGFDINPSLTIAYVADQRSTAGGIQKWTNSGTAWGLAYTFTTGAGAFGMAVDFSNAAPVVYSTTGEANSNRLVRIEDTSSSAIVTLLGTPGSNKVFRALDFAPEHAKSALPVSLAIQRSAANVVLSWPSVATGYVLEVNSRVDLSNGWSTATEPVVMTNNLNTVTVPVTNRAQFYRLAQ